MDFFQYPGFILRGEIQIPTQLKIHPEIRRHSEKFRQTQRRRRGDAAPSVHDIIDPLVGDMDGVGQLALVSFMGFKNSSNNISPGCVGVRDEGTRTIKITSGSQE